MSGQHLLALEIIRAGSKVIKLIKSYLSIGGQQ